MSSIMIPLSIRHSPWHLPNPHLAFPYSTNYPHTKLQFPSAGDPFRLTSIPYSPSQHRCHSIRLRLHLLQCVPATRTIAWLAQMTRLDRPSVRPSVTRWQPFLLAMAVLVALVEQVATAVVVVIPPYTNQTRHLCPMQVVHLPLVQFPQTTLGASLNPIQT